MGVLQCWTLIPLASTENISLPASKPGRAINLTPGAASSHPTVSTNFTPAINVLLRHYLTRQVASCVARVPLDKFVLHVRIGQRHTLLQSAPPGAVLV